MKTLKSNISEAYKVQADCLKDTWSDSFDKNVIKEKVNEILTLVPDKWSRMYCSEYFNIFEYLV